MGGQKRKHSSGAGSSPGPKRQRRRSKSSRPVAPTLARPTAAAAAKRYNPLDAQQHSKRGSARERLARIRVGLGAAALESGFYRTAQEQPRSGALGSFFGDEVHELALAFHATTSFAQLRYQLRDLVLTKALLLHHRDKVVELLIKHIEPLTDALDAIAKLTYFLCRDIQGLFLQYVPRLTTALVTAAAEPLPGGLPHPERVSAVFLAIAGWLRVLAPVVAHDADKADALLRPLLEQGLGHAVPAVARLTGEAAAGLLRRAADPAVLTRLVATVSECAGAAYAAAPEAKRHRAVLGAAVLWFEALRGVGGRWHSRVAELVPTILARLDTAPAEEATAVRHSVAQATEQCGFHATRETFPELFGALAAAGSSATGPLSLECAAACLGKLLGHKLRARIFSPEAYAAVSDPLPRVLSAVVQAVEKGTDALEPALQLFGACAQHDALRDVTLAAFRRLLALQLPLRRVAEVLHAAAAAPSTAAALHDAAAAAVSRSREEGTREVLAVLLALEEGSGDAATAELPAVGGRAVLRALADPGAPDAVQWAAWHLARGAAADQRREVCRVAEAALQRGGQRPLIAAACLDTLRCTARSPAAAASAAGRLLADTELGGHPAVAQSAERALRGTAPGTLQGFEAAAVDACLRQLCAPQHAVRLAALRLLPVIHPGATGESGSTMRRVLELAEKGETLRASDLSENRAKVLAYDSIAQLLRHSAALPPGVLAVAARCLFGALHVRFRTLWPKLQEGLEVVAEADFECFWSIFREQLAAQRAAGGPPAADAEQDSDDESGNEEDEEDEEEEDAGNAHAEDDAVQRAWSEQLRAEVDHDHATAQSHFTAMWGLIERLRPALVSSHAADIFAEFQRECGAEQPRGPVPLRARLVAFLKVFARFEGVEQMPIAKQFRRSLWDLLSFNCQEVQRLVLGALRQLAEFRKLLGPGERVTALLESKGFRSALMRLELDSVTAHNMQELVFLLLRPAVWHNANQQRGAVLNMVASLSEDKVARFMEMIVMPIVAAHRSPSSRAPKFLEFLAAVVEQFGSRLEPWIMALLRVLVTHLAGSSGGKSHRGSRKACLRTLAKVFKQFPDLDFPDDILKDLTEALRGPLESLGASGGNAAGPLMGLLRVVADEPALAGVLERIEALPVLCRLLGSRSVSSEVYCGALEVINAALAGVPACFIPVREAFLGGVHSASTAGWLQGDTQCWAATVTTLSAAAPHLLEMRSDERLAQLMGFLVDSLRNRKLRPPLDAAERCTDVLIAVLPRISPAARLAALSNLAPLFGVVEWPQVRSRLAAAYRGAAEAALSEADGERSVTDAFVCGVGAALEATNSVRGEEDYDFDRRLDGFYRVAEFFQSWGLKKSKRKAGRGGGGDGEGEESSDDAARTQSKKGRKAVSVAQGAHEKVALPRMLLTRLRPEHVLALAHNLAYFVSDWNQSIRSTAALALRALIAACCRAGKRGVTGLRRYVLAPTVQTGTAVGMRNKDGAVRREWLRVFGAYCHSFELTPGLTNANTDFDFYTNITHAQIVRQLKGLSSLREHSKSVTDRTMEKVFIPYLLKMLHDCCGDKRREQEDDLTKSEAGKLIALSQAILQTFAAIAAHLKWVRYSRLVQVILTQDLPNQAMEKSIAKCICKVLDEFSFLPTQRIGPARAPAADEDADDQDELSETGDGDEAAAGSTRRIGDDLVDKIIPMVHRWWKKGDKKEDGKEVVSLARMPVAVSLLRLLKHVPPDVDMEGVIDVILTEVSSKLKTKKAPQREVARGVLCDAFETLGPSFLTKMVFLLRGSLVHGYQLHVLGYTVVSLLHRVGEAERASQYIDAAMEPLIDVLLDDYIGAGATEKEVEELAKTMKEIKKNRALEGLELLAARATPQHMLGVLVRRVQQIFSRHDTLRKRYRPEEKSFQRTDGAADQEDSEAESEPEVEDSAVDLRLQDKIRDILRKCARGVVRNPLADVDALIAFAGNTLRSNAAAREAFFERFEVKQASCRVRHAQRTNAEKRSTMAERAAAQWVVEAEPERKDKGFEKVEVTSQRRQLGSAPKGKKGGKKRILIPTKEGRRSLQSMDCVDELAVSVAWSLVTHAPAKGVVAKVGTLVEPLMNVLGGDQSDNVVGVALHVLIELLKEQTVPLTEDDEKRLVEIIFEVVERPGEVRSACFRLLSVLLLHRSGKLNEHQVMICCSLVRTDLDKQNTFMIPALHFLKGLVTKRIEVPDVYDLVPVLQEKMLHHASSRTVAQLSGAVIARFLTDWRMTPKRLHSHVDFVVQNLQYPVDTGRLALLGLLEVVFQRFPEELVQKEIEYFFVPVAHRLAVDESPQVKKKAAAVLGSLFRAAGPALQSIVGVLKAWINDEDPSMVVTAVQALNVLFSAAPELAAPHVGSFYPSPLLMLCAPTAAEGAAKKARKRSAVRKQRDEWELVYHSLVALEALVTRQDKRGAAEDAQTPWNRAVAHLQHSHPWVRTAAARLVAAHSSGELHRRADAVRAARASIQQLCDLDRLSPEGSDEADLRPSRGGGASEPDGGPVETEMDAQLSRLAIKNVVWLLSRLRAGKLSSPAEVLGLWKAAREGACGEMNGDQLRQLNPWSFFQRFHTVRTAAFVRLVGALCVHTFGSTASDTDQPALQVAPQDRPLIEHVCALMDLVFACATIPPPAAPLAKLAKEVLAAITTALQQEELVGLKHRLAEQWREVTAERQLRARRAASVRKRDGRRLATPARPRMGGGGGGEHRKRGRSASSGPGGKGGASKSGGKGKRPRK